MWDDIRIVFKGLIHIISYFFITLMFVMLHTSQPALPSAPRVVWDISLVIGSLSMQLCKSQSKFFFFLYDTEFNMSDLLHVSRLWVHLKDQMISNWSSTFLNLQNKKGTLNNIYVIDDVKCLFATENGPLFFSLYLTCMQSDYIYRLCL